MKRDRTGFSRPITASRMILLIGLEICMLAGGAAATPAASQAVPGDPLVLAHYYIWFEATSWNRAKIDYPTVGRYTSDQESVMRDHIRLAKSVGIDAFLVSWKSTEVLDPRLEMLIAIAEEEDFQLAITYQGLDFNRDPLPAARVGDDLDLFVDRYSDSPAFQLFDQPLVIWSGTWKYSHDEIAAVTSARAGRLLVLATEKNVEGYERVADAVDGNLYYWSSVNPDTYPGYPTKLVEMGDAVRAHDGIWIAPAAPGFDAQLLGGETVVERDGGATLAAEWSGALASVPDAIGLISWNEFSENTHIEPSVAYGSEALNAVADLTNAPRPAAVDFDSSAPEGRSSGGSSDQIIRISLLLGFIAMIGLSVFTVRRRQTEHADVL